MVSLFVSRANADNNNKEVDTEVEEVEEAEPPTRCTIEYTVVGCASFVTYHPTSIQTKRVRGHCVAVTTGRKVCQSTRHIDALNSACQ